MSALGSWDRITILLLIYLFSKDPLTIDPSSNRNVKLSQCK